MKRLVSLPTATLSAAAALVLFLSAFSSRPGECQSSAPQAESLAARAP